MLNMAYVVFVLGICDHYYIEPPKDSSGNINSVALDQRFFRCSFHSVQFSDTFQKKAITNFCALAKLHWIEISFMRTVPIPDRALIWPQHKIVHFCYVWQFLACKVQCVDIACAKLRLCYSFVYSYVPVFKTDTGRSYISIVRKFDTSKH